ncbi:MAG: 30S ribosome-binding factor RbfA [Clostridiales bacterium]|jgi:ribosome-binding factor A|nr:30S ribosome-binding factor RbfA [Clostridiales bacterium]
MRHQRIDRISEEVKKEVSRIIREEVKDPRIGQLASILRADVSGDLRLAKIYVSVLGDDNERASTMAGLTRAAGFIRKELGRALKIRYVPELSFILDTSIEYSVDISKKIREVTSQQEKANEDD